MQIKSMTSDLTNLLISVIYFQESLFNLIIYSEMKITFSLLLLCSLAIIGALSQCTGYKTQVPGFPAGFCIQTCANPMYSNCPANFVVPASSQQVPQFCGYVKVGTGFQWRNFTYGCQACRTPGVVGFYFGCCTCQYTKCPAGYTCERGNCIPDQPVDTSCANDASCTNGQICENNKCIAPLCTSNSQCTAGNLCQNGRCRKITCADITCTGSGEVCEQGVCVRKFDTFCSNTFPQITRRYCANPRPTQAECPDRVIQTFVQGGYCGVAVTGELISFALQCEPCKRTYVQYYYSQACSTVPRKCTGRQSCLNGVCVDPNSPVDPCLNRNCPAGTYCNNGACLAIQGYCQTAATCGAGYDCVGNRCVAVNLCATVRCNEDSTCVNGACVSLCSIANCQPGWSCTRGVCYRPQGYCASDAECLTNQKCLMNQCFNLAPQPGTCQNNNQCTANQICQNNYCIARPIGYCLNDNQCAANQVCTNNYCVIRVGYCQSDNQCTANQYCQNNLCVARPIGYCQSDNQCAANQYCQNNFCVARPGYCQYDNQCPGNQICLNSYCAARPAGYCLNDNQCAANQVCQNNFCAVRPGYCTSDFNCASNSRCISNYCYVLAPQPQPVPQNNTCRADANCGTNQRCFGGYCYVIATPNTNTRPGACQTDFQCYNGQRCFDGYCFVQAQPSSVVRPGSCQSDSNCFNNQRCLDGYCYVRSTEQPTQSTIYCLSDNYCGTGQRCFNGYCYTLAPVDQTSRGCPYTPCPANTQCRNGICQSTGYGRVCSLNSQCQSNQVCLGSYCRVQSCRSNVECYGNRCRNGYCVPY